MDGDVSRNRTPLSVVMKNIKNMVSLNSEIHVSEHIYSGVNDIFNYLADIPMPACVVIYKGSKYSCDISNRHNFTLLLIDGNQGNYEEGLDIVQGLTDDVISLIDSRVIEDESIWIDLISVTPVKFNNNCGYIGMALDVVAEDN
jgi:hypothetical protein